MFQEETKSIQFSKIRRGLQYIVSKTFVNSPDSPLQVIEAFNLESVWTSFGLTKDKANPLPFYTACIFEDQKHAFCIFSSLKIISEIKENIPPPNRKYLIDGTFKIVPKGCFNQLLVICIQYFDRAIFLSNFHYFLNPNYFRYFRYFLF